MNTATFSSTMLVNITSNDPKEISDQVNKALNDVLSKLNNLSNSINTTQTQAQATYAPLPQSAAGVGQVYPWMSGSYGGAFVLPAGGSWWWWGFNWNTSNILNWYGGISAGGTTVIAGISGFFTYGMALRIG